ncbi:hypothetical protein Zmor_023481 [Zophobas morio]|uniref:Uncharacterized protein n=1 Tax=Zophobas morio TaxID=2755281 RepID=A0AA38HYC7_9CUCU|nr:hypothetical protein Zmor_023481 [Zophobas morio]
MFSSPEEQQRFVVSLRHYMEYSNPEQNADGEVNQNAGQQQVDEDSGRESGNSNEIVIIFLKHSPPCFGLTGFAEKKNKEES